MAFSKPQTQSEPIAVGALSKTNDKGDKRIDCSLCLDECVRSWQSSAVAHPEVSTATTVPPVHGRRGPTDYDSQGCQHSVMCKLQT